MTLLNKKKISLILICSLFFGCISSCSTYETPKKPPNIIIIYVDDLGYGDLSVYGGKVNSPNIQRIADMGIKFTDFYVSAPICTPSRFSLLTGNYPQRSLHGLDQVGMPGDSSYLDSKEKIIPEYLKQKGYETALFGKWHLGSKREEYYPNNHGFDKFVGHLDGCIDYFNHSYSTLQNSWYQNVTPFSEEGYSTDLITDHATNYIKEMAVKDSPYFMYLSYNAPHYGKSDPENMSDSSTVLKVGSYKGVSYANTLQVPLTYLNEFSNIENEYKRFYAGMIRSLDDNIGRVLDTLEKNSLNENTMIWFISDNGGYSESYSGYASNGKLRGEKGGIYEGGIRVPALMCWKGKIESNQVINQPLSNIDILPTLLSIVDYKEVVLTTDGIDISKVLLENKRIDRNIFWKFKKQVGLRHGDWKVLNDELFNLKQDAGETTDVSKQYPIIYERLVKERDKVENQLLNMK